MNSEYEFNQRKQKNAKRERNGFLKKTLLWIGGGLVVAFGTAFFAPLPIVLLPLGAGVIGGSFYAVKTGKVNGKLKMLKEDEQRLVEKINMQEHEAKGETQTKENNYESIQVEEPIKENTPVQNVQVEPIKEDNPVQNVQVEPIKENNPVQVEEPVKRETQENLNVVDNYREHVLEPYVDQQFNPYSDKNVESYKNIQPEEPIKVGTQNERENLKVVDNIQDYNLESYSDREFNPYEESQSTNRRRRRR